MEVSTVYTVHAYRWGDREEHSYTVGVYSTKRTALIVAEREKEHRGGKYECEVLGFIPDIEHSQVTILSLPSR